MLNIIQNLRATHQDHTHCSGCSLCLLVCPVWRQHRDVRFTPQGHAKALQQGTPVETLSETAFACHACGACHPICPEKIAIIPMFINLRQQLLNQSISSDTVASIQSAMQAISTQPTEKIKTKTCFLAGAYLRQQPEILQQVLHLLGKTTSLIVDDGEDIIQALQMGVTIPTARLEKFLYPLRKAKQVIISEGILYQALQQWLPKVKIGSLGKILTNLPNIRSKLQKTDLYIIECRAYHADFEKLVKHYDQLRKTVSCQFNLDLQRIAIPTTSDNLDDLQQAKWVLEGRQVERIVVENWADALVLQQVTTLPIVHLAAI